MTAAAPVMVLCGPSGVGKGTVIAGLRQRVPDLWLSVSATTRAARQGETDGVEYFFLPRERFEAMIADDSMLEWAEYAGNLYGTPRRPVEERQSAGTPVLLEIELAGARQVRRSLPEAIQVFLAPPSMTELERRLRGRGTESEEQMQSRLRQARSELAAAEAGEFDHVVVNDDVRGTVRRLLALMGEG